MLVLLKRFVGKLNFPPVSNDAQLPTPLIEHKLLHIFYSSSLVHTLFDMWSELKRLDRKEVTVINVVNIPLLVPLRIFF